jgi:hypothetical protein
MGWRGYVVRRVHLRTGEIAARKVSDRVVRLTTEHRVPAGFNLTDARH